MRILPGGEFLVLVAPILGGLFFCLRLAEPLAAQEGTWPVSCQVERPTIFDRPVELHEGVLSVPEVPRHEDALGIEGRHVEIGDGVRIWVEEVGEGPPLLLVSGGPGTSHHYFHPSLIPAASLARLIYVDLRGVGLSDGIRPDGGYTVEGAVKDLDQVREALGLSSWSVLGYSFGGTVAQLYALEYPTRVERLVLASSTVPMAVDLGLGSRQRDYMSAREIERVGEVYSVNGEGVVPAHSDLVSPEAQRSMLYNGFRNGDWKRRHICKMSDDEIARFARYEFVHARDYYSEMVASGQALDLRSRIAELNVPTLIIEGRWDLAFGAGKAERMRELYPRARVVVLEEAGHTLFEDDPSGFFGTLGRFMASGPSGSINDGRRLGRSAARSAAEGAREFAMAEGWRMVFAVLDAAGDPVLVERMDGAQPASVEIALEKARAALAFQRPTSQMQEWVVGGSLHLLGLPGIVPVEGGIPIWDGTRLVGAIGVSGASSAEDGRAAQAALDALSALWDVPLSLHAPRPQ